MPPLDFKYMPEDQLEDEVGNHLDVFSANMADCAHLDPFLSCLVALDTDLALTAAGEDEFGPDRDY